MKKKYIIIGIIVFIVMLIAFISDIVFTLMKDEEIALLEKNVYANYPDFKEFATLPYGGGEGQESGKIMIGKSEEKYIIANAYKERLLSKELKYSQREVTMNNNPLVSSIFPDSIYVMQEDFMMMVLKGKSWDDMEKYKEDIIKIITKLDTSETFVLHIFLSPDNNINTNDHKALLLANYSYITRENVLNNAHFLKRDFLLSRKSDEQKSEEFWRLEFNKEMLALDSF